MLRPEPPSIVQDGSKDEADVMDDVASLALYLVGLHLSGHPDHSKSKINSNVGTLHSLPLTYICTTAGKLKHAPNELSPWLQIR